MHVKETLAVGTAAIFETYAFLVWSLDDVSHRASIFEPARHPCVRRAPERARLSLAGRSCVHIGGVGRLRCTSLPEE